MNEVTRILQEQWTSQNEIAYATAKKWIRRDYDCTGGRAQWLTGGSGGDSLEGITQTVICHAWELFVNGSIADPSRPLKDRCKAAIGMAIKRVVKSGRLFRQSDRNPSAGHLEACKGRLNRTTYESHEGAVDHCDLVNPGIAWGEDRSDDKAYRVPENHEALDRLVSRITAQNCERHSETDCRSYRKIVAALIASNGNITKAAKKLEVPVRTLGYRLHHVADALRQVLVIDEAMLQREAVEAVEHTSYRCYQDPDLECLPEVLEDLGKSVNDLTGGGHDWTRPNADRVTGNLGRQWETAIA